MIRKVEEYDVEEICKIYNFYVKNTIITFEEEEVSPDDMHSRVQEILKDYTWLVFEKDKKVLGYAYASKWKARSAYKFSAESTVYLHHDHTAKGIGSKLYQALISETKERELHTLIGGIALPNEKSIALHEKLGFKKCAQFSEVGFKFNQWIDVGYWEKKL